MSENCRSSALLTLSLDVGSRIALATSHRRAWLAAITEDERRPCWSSCAPATNRPGPRCRPALTRRCRIYRSLGVACSFGDWQKNVNAIARAFQPGGGLPPMVINCGGPSFTVSPEFLLGEVRPRLVEMVSRIEAALNR